MSRMNRIAGAFCAVALTALAACGNAPGLGDELDATGPFLAAVKAQLLPNRGTPPQSVFDTGTPEQVMAAVAPYPGRLKVLFVPGAKQSGLLLDVGTNGDVTYWATPSGQSYALQDGVLIATRGMNFDLMSAQVGRSPDLIRRRATGNTEKVYRYLDGEDHEVELYAKCTVSPRGAETIRLVSGKSYATTKMRESCIAGRLTFNNYFWVDAAGTVVQSRQFSGAETGELVFQTLRD